MLGVIWAQAHDGVIGDAGAIPWRLPEDQARFKQLTFGATVLMGRRTWQSLPASVRPLPGRRNLVLSSDPHWSSEGAERVGSVGAALDLVEGDLWVIGGSAVYAAALPLADRLEVTYVDLRCDGDAFAPDLGPGWRPILDSDWLTSASGLRYKLVTFERDAAIPSMT
ncbi:MAG TPA: dihydrofolate reductase [Mycobacteriales bacterium]|nr:dihydrofolate reductase [Mycobacteriales bacterium]